MLTPTVTCSPVVSPIAPLLSQVAVITPILHGMCADMVRLIEIRKPTGVERTTRLPLQLAGNHCCVLANCSHC